MKNWQSGYVESNGIRLHYTRSGGDKPAVVLAHGFSDSGLCWTPVAEQLQSDYDVVMIDARGHGQSDAPETGYSSVEHAADAAGVIEKLQLHRPAILGHSMGAATTLMLAATYPDVPRAILLEDPPAWWMGTSERARIASAEWREQRRREIIERQAMTRDELIAQQRLKQPRWSEAELHPWADAKLRLSLNVLNQDLRSMHDWAELVGHITCPALLIIADQDQGALVSHEAAERLKQLLPDLDVAYIADAGHNIRRMQFKHYMQVITDFLSRSAATD